MNDSIKLDKIKSVIETLNFRLPALTAVGCLSGESAINNLENHARKETLRVIGDILKGDSNEDNL